MVKICKYCQKECKNLNSLTQHEIRCDLNPRRIIIKRNKWTKEMKDNMSIIMKDRNTNKNRDWSAESLDKISKWSKKFNKDYWTDDKRNLHSDKMKDVVSKNQDSYSINNISGRVKNIEYNEFRLRGNWELSVAKWLDKNNIRWTNKINGHTYTFKNRDHLYFPDFYLIDLDIFIEVKGYEREIDKYKWFYFPKKLIILRQNEISLINKGNPDYKTILKLI